MLLLIDNYDSFTFNLYQYLGELGAEVVVRRHDEISVEEALALGPERIVISPGPCTPDEAGISVGLVRAAAAGAQPVPLLGVCLGHQCIAQAFGGVVDGAGEILHGKTSRITHDGDGLFAGLPEPFEAIRYHSLAVESGSLPPELEVTARAESGVIMALRHRSLPIVGVQFHPESIATEAGHALLRNFLEMPARAPAAAGGLGGS